MQPVNVQRRAARELSGSSENSAYHWTSTQLSRCSMDLYLRLRQHSMTISAEFTHSYFATRFLYLGSDSYKQFMRHTKVPAVVNEERSLYDDECTRDR